MNLSQKKLNDLLEEARVKGYQQGHDKGVAMGKTQVVDRTQRDFEARLRLVEAVTLATNLADAFSQTMDYVRKTSSTPY